MIVYTNYTLYLDQHSLISQIHIQKNVHYSKKKNYKMFLQKKMLGFALYVWNDLAILKTCLNLILNCIF